MFGTGLLRDSGFANFLAYRAQFYAATSGSSCDYLEPVPDVRDCGARER